MAAVDCAIVIERLGDNYFRASCPLFPDCQAVADTEAAARQAVAESIGRILRERQETLVRHSLAERDNEDVA